MSGNSVPPMMWSTGGRSDRLPTPPTSNVATDHFNNNPYSRNNPINQPQHPTVPKVQSDPWNWGWDDNGSGSGQGGTQEENDLWGAQPQQSAPPPLHHPSNQHHHHPPPQYNTPTMNSSEFFENIDLSSGPIGTTATNKLYNQQQPTNHYPNQHSQQYHQQNFHQPPPPPPISTSSSYSYFQFAEPPKQPQSSQSSNPSPLVSQYPPPNSTQLQATPSFNSSNHNLSQQFHQQPSQPNFMPPQPHNYNQFSSPPFSQQHTLPQQQMYSSPINSINNNNNVSAEVENREIAPPEKSEKNTSVLQSTPSSLNASPATVILNNNNNNSALPENQETVPENEERPPDSESSLTASINNLRLNSPPNIGGSSVETLPSATPVNDQLQWNSVSGWENQEVAPKFTVDRDQYLETGHLHPPSSQLLQSQQSSGANDNDLDTNDEGEAVPPPGLHRLVTGQGQTVSQERLVVGSPPPSSTSSSGPPSLLQRPQVPGFSMQQQSDLINHPSPPPLGQRMIPGQLRDDDMERMVLGSSRNNGNDTIQPPREPLLQNSSMSQRTVPGGRSNDVEPIRDQQQNPVSQRTVPGGCSTSSSGSSSSYTQLQDLQSEERLVLGRTTIDQGDDRLQPQQNSSGHMSVTSMWSSVPTSHQDSVVTTMPASSYSGDSDIQSQQPPRPPSNSNSIVGAEQSRSNSIVSDPPPGLHRMVLGHPDNGSRGGSASGDEISQSSVPPPGLHRMVLGEQQQEQKQPQQDQQPQQTPVSSQQSQSQSQGSNADNEDCDKERDIDSENEYRINRRKHHRRDSVEDDRDYPSDRERDRRHQDYWDRRYDERSRRNFKERSHHPSYDHSPEFRSDEDLDRDRNDYRDYRTGRPGRDRRYYEPHHYRDRNMYEEEYYYRDNRSSRPSSRSGVDYSRRTGGNTGPRDYMPPRNVHPYYPDQGAYHMQYYQWQQQFYEMRRNDPQAYTAWYEQYMASKYGQSVHHPDDSRTSVNSGRSSANHHRTPNEKVLLDESVNKAAMNTSSNVTVGSSISTIDPHGNQVIKDDTDDTSGVATLPQRYTPLLYPTGAHIKGKWGNQGQLVLISPNYPHEGQQPIVEVIQLLHNAVQNDPDILEFLDTPGPFIVGVTHKNTVLQYLKKRADQATHNAEKLLYELIQLVIRLNGIVDMTDVADLLITNYNEDLGAEHDEQYSQQQHHGDYNSQQDLNVVSELSSQNVTDKFRELLLQGNKLDALEWAIQNKNWGHAFFLASKMDTRSYNNVMLRFANGLPVNDPLQTLYQMMSGREPQAATCCADKKWGDWRPHLAMMLSNPSGNPDIDRKSIITLGDSLASKGRLFASHFCYVTAQVDFVAYTDRSAKLVLLGTSHHQPFAQFATCRSIMLTLCYEFAKRLNKKDLVIPALQVYKYLLATRLIENGKLANASQYLEALALDMIHRPSRQNRPLASLVTELADQIKMADPALAIISDPNDDPDWLNTLKQILDDTNETNLQTSSMSHGISTSTVSTSAADPPLSNQVVGGYIQEQVYYDNNVHSWNQADMQNLDSTQYNTGYPTAPNVEIDQYQQPQQQMNSLQSTGNGSVINADYNSLPPISTNQHVQSQNANTMTWDPVNNMYTNNWQDQSQHMQPQMSQSLPPITSSMSTTTSVQDTQKQMLEKKSNKDENSNRKKTKSKEQASSGWFGGIWDKLALRPKNQMKLPDDKNPSIVWDEKKGRWVNKDGDDEGEGGDVKPPPKAAELPGFSAAMPVATPAPGPSIPPPVASPAVDPNSTIMGSAPAAASTPTAAAASDVPPPSSNNFNKFKMQRGRGMKSNYIDVMNPNSTKKAGAPNAPQGLVDPVTAPPAPVNNYFIPAPVEGIDNAPIDFVSPSGHVSYEASHKGLDQTTELSRSSSASSLSREVSNIMSRGRHQPFQSKSKNVTTRHLQTRLHSAANYSSSQDVPTFYNPNSFTVT